MEHAQSHAAANARGSADMPLFFRTAAAHCGQASVILSPELQDWFKRSLGCVAGRREFSSDRYFVVEVRQLSDVVAGWRHFVRALERRETVACLYVIPRIDGIVAHETVTTKSSALDALTAVSEVMSVLSDQSPEFLLHGGQLNFVLHLDCPITGMRTAFFDFDAVAFVPQAQDPADALYDPLMAAPVPMVNINSDIYGFSMFTRDHALARFDCEVVQLTKRERRYLFSHAAESWQRMAERTIDNYAQIVDQKLCPTYLTAERDGWIANHKDPAFAETEKKPYLHEMPVHYARRVIEAWDEYFEHGVAVDYRGVSVEGEDPASRCPHRPQGAAT